MGNFDINTGLNFINSFDKFNNNINDFNKSFNINIQSDKKEQNLDFKEVLNSINKNSEISATEKTAQDIGSGFKNGIRELNEVQRKAETDLETFASGGDISIHEVMISAEKSSLAMQMAIQLRTQMLNAYNEFKNMQL